MNFNLSTASLQPFYSKPRFRLVMLLASLLLPLLACGLFTPQYQMNNQVRLAVYNYERATQGPVDQLLIAFNRNELRIKFEGQDEDGGRTVWLYDLAAREYFAQLAPDTTFMYIQEIDYFDNYRQAKVTVYRGDKNNYTGQELTLQHDGRNGQWQVSAAQALNTS